MIAVDAVRAAAPRLFRRSAADAWLVAAALLHGAALAAAAAAAQSAAALVAAASLVAVGLWWNSNTVSHNHLHNPFFRSAPLNRAFAAYLTALLGIPQTIWRHRHLRHHAGDRARRMGSLRLGAAGAVEVALVAAVWLALAAAAPRFFIAAYLPGCAVGLGLCYLQGRFEHASAPAGVSHYGAVYNLLWFNDGHHAEHHRWPHLHWTELAARRFGAGALLGPSSAGTCGDAAAVSRLPPVMRVFERIAGRANALQAAALEALERVTMPVAAIPRFLVDCHERAFRRLLAARPGIRLDHVAVVGGGLFPRTVLVLRRIAPGARIVVIDASASNVERARAHLAQLGAATGVDFLAERFVPARHRGFDLVVIPLGYRGDRAALYQGGAGGPVVIHDWLWRVRGQAGAVVSPLLLKRVNLIVAHA